MQNENFAKELNEIKGKKREKFVTNRSLFIKVVLAFVTVGIISTYFMSDYLKKIALSNLAEDNAKKTSELVFEVLYAKMQSGWNRDDIKNIIKRLNSLNSGMDVKIYRTPVVEELFGVIDGDREAIKNDALLAKAIKGEIQFIPNEKDSSVRYIYPMRVEKECLSCHTNANVGDINGVIDIYLPGKDIQIPLDNIIKYFLIFTVIAIIFTFTIFQFLMNRIFIEPISKFTNSIDKIMINSLFNDYVRCNPKTHEVYVLELTFNNLLSKVNNMLAEIRNKNKLLEEYKKAIDSSTIVTKTDKKGLITYVNEEFCRISGYKEEELLGKPHNIVRSPNMPKEAFKELWETLKQKKAWSGVVENRKKNGDSYFVQATIMPILDENNETVEYIAIRQDITELKRFQVEEIVNSVNRALEVNLNNTVNLIPFPAVIIDGEHNIRFTNSKFKSTFAYTTWKSDKLDNLFIKREGYVYFDEVIDWKDVLLDFQNSSVEKVLIEIDGVEQEFMIMLNQINERFYIVYLMPL